MKPAFGISYLILLCHQVLGQRNAAPLPFPWPGPSIPVPSIPVPVNPPITESLCGVGSQQSPIDLVQTPKVNISPDILLTLNNLNVYPDGATLTNKGTAGFLVVNSDENNAPTVEISPSALTNALNIQTSTDYVLARAQIYANPSIHSLRGIFYDLEVQIVFKADSDTRNPVPIGGLKPADQIRVVILFQTGGKCNPYLTPITELAGRISEVESNTTTKATIPLCNLIPENTGWEFYRGSSLYNGCPETVAYAVATTPNTMSIEQATKFINWQNEDGGVGSTNEHPQSALNGRLIYTSPNAKHVCPTISI